MSGEEARMKLGDLLYIPEREEIKEVENVYFFDIIGRKKKGELKMGGTHNRGWDTEEGDYVYEIHDHVQYRYELIKVLGRGSFGVVLRVFDHKKKEFCALKVIRNRERLHKQGLVEANILETLRDNDPDQKKNIVNIIDHFKFREHVFITFELLSMNLYEFIRKNNFEGVSMRLT